MYRKIYMVRWTRDIYPYHVFSRPELDMKTGKYTVRPGMWGESNKDITLATNNYLDIVQE